MAANIIAATSALGTFAAVVVSLFLAGKAERNAKKDEETRFLLATFDKLVTEFTSLKLDFAGAQRRMAAARIQLYLAMLPPSVAPALRFEVEGKSALAIDSLFRTRLSHDDNGSALEQRLQTIYEDLADSARRIRSGMI